jgi:tripartite-type tricarboxylate transporter receptor subunit TctC
VPTLDETVIPGFDMTGWGGISGPANLPADVVAKLETSVQKALQDPEILKRFAASGIEVFGGGSKEFESYVRTQLANWTALIKETGIQPE